MTIRYKADHTVTREVTPAPIEGTWMDVNDYYHPSHWEPVLEKRWVPCKAWQRYNGDLCFSADAEPITIVPLPPGMRIVEIAPGTVRFEREEE